VLFVRTLGGYLEGTLNSNGNITDVNFYYWGDGDSNTLEGLRCNLISSKVTNITINFNPIFGSTKYRNPVNPRDLLPVFDSNNQPLAGTFGHGLGNDANLGGILPGMTQQDWTDLLGLSAAALVPNVVSMTDVNANTAITDANLVVGTVTTTYSNTVVVDKVISQSPAAGTKVAIGSPVDYVKSLGKPTVPNVVGMTVADANTAITSVNLKVGTVTTAYDNNVAAGTVISQSPAKDTKVLIGTAVNYVKSLGKKPTVSITAFDSQAAETVAGETANPGVFRISRADGSTSNALTVYFTRAGTALYSSDYTLSVGTAISAIIPADANHVDITVTPVDNLLYEPNETVILTLTANAAYNLTPTVPQRTATVTIADNEPTISIAATDSQASEPNNTGTFTISRTGSTAGPLTVYFTRSGTAIFGAAGDYTLSTLLATSVVIPKDQNYVDITVTPVDNSLAEPNETVILTLTANAAYNLTPTVPQRTATVTIADNEPTISITASDSQASEPNNTGTFTISRTGSTAGPLTVYFTRSGTAIFGSGATADYNLSGNGLSAIATSAVIPADANHVDITVTPVDNLLYEPNETVILTLTANATYNLAPTVPQRTATVTIADNNDVVGTWTGTWYGDGSGSFTINLKINNTLTGTFQQLLEPSGTVTAPLSGTYSFDSASSVFTFQSQGITTIQVPGYGGVRVRYFINGSGHANVGNLSGDYEETAEYYDGSWWPLVDESGTWVVTHP